MVIKFNPLSFTEKIFGRKYYLALLKGHSTDSVSSTIFDNRQEAEDFVRSIQYNTVYFYGGKVITIRSRIPLRIAEKEV